ncbi:hypothetical protein [Ekhidna sp. To15]|uniref:hypothetical protein n=1 Tax=Ekhidna sp. To15 TaxID=3395267 RepID=UPI003F51D8BB
MIQKIKLFIFFLIPLLASSQSPEEDEVKLKSALGWLEIKLDYLYYENTSERWWNNTFYANENNEITIKHIVSDRPNTANIRDKTYTIRKFRIQDINPKSLKITDVKESRGRVVKGQMLELRTYGFQDLIHKSINNRRASSTSFLFLSFPETLVDSLSNYAEVVKSKFEDAIVASIQIYANNDESDINTIMKVLTGDYKTTNGMIWNAELVEANVLKVDRGSKIIEYFGYDPSLQMFYLLSISGQGVKKQSLSPEKGTRLKISNSNGLTILIDTPHSFMLNGKAYFRQ